MCFGLMLTAVRLVFPCSLPKRVVGKASMGSFKRIIELAKNYPLVVFLIGAALMAFATIADPPTPDQLKQQQEQTRRQEILEKYSSLAEQEKQREKKYICRRIDVCRKYGEARQECAIAGDFNNCVSVKLGDDVYLSGACTVDGKFPTLPNDSPNRVQCFFIGLSD